MAEQTDIMNTLKGGLGFAGKLAGKGFNEVSGLIKGDDSAPKGLSGVYWQRGPWSNGNDLIPEIDFMESQDLGKFKVSLVRRVTTSKAERAFTQACGCCVSSDSAGLENSAKEVVESDPQFTDGYFMLGCYYLENHRPNEAVTNFQKALLCQQGLGSKFKKHLPSFRMILPLTPSSAIALYPDLLGVNVLLALAQRQLGQSEAALATMQQLLGIMPTEPLVLFFIAVLRLENGQFGPLVDELRDVLPGSTLQVANLLLLGYSCNKLGDVTTARDIYRSALEKSDYDPLMRLDLQYAMGKSLGNVGAGDIDAIYRDCPSYQPFFTRLGLRVGEGASPASSSAKSSGIAAVSSVAPVKTATSQANSVGTQSANSAASSTPLPFIPSATLTSEAEAVKNIAPGTATVKISMPELSHVVEPLPPKTGDKVSLCCPERKLEFALNQGEMTVGRDEGEIRISTDGSVSRKHATILFNNGRYLVKDLDSTNGTWLNGYRLNSGSFYEVNRGDSLQFGLTKFRML